MRTVTIGIDPGASGAICTLDYRGDIIECEDLGNVANGGVTSPALFAALLDRMTHGIPDSIGVAVVEHVHARPPASAASIGKLCTSYGIVLGALAHAGIRIETVTPAVWKRAMRVGTGQKDPNAVAANRWPHDRDLFLRKLDKDRAEACLLAAWWLDRAEAVAA